MKRRKVKFIDEVEEIHISKITEDMPIEIRCCDKIIGYATYDGKNYHAITTLGSWIERNDLKAIKTGIEREHECECEFILLDLEF